MRVSMASLTLSCSAKTPILSHSLQLALGAVSRWNLQWRFSFGFGPEKSATIDFGPNRQRPACSVTLGESVLLVAQSYRSPHPFSHQRDAHAENLVWSSSVCPTRLVGSRRRAPSVTQPFLATCVLRSATFDMMFLGNCSRSMARCDAALIQWGRHLLGWPSSSPNASVLCELGLLDSLHISHPVLVCLPLARTLALRLIGARLCSNTMTLASVDRDCLQLCRRSGFATLCSQ